MISGRGTPGVLPLSPKTERRWYPAPIFRCLTRTGKEAMSVPRGSPDASGGMIVTIDHFDVLIVGAGLSGIGAGYHLQSTCPDKTYAILEGRGAIGGTWDLFRYPGIRSDSDMYTLGYSFRPWKEQKSIAD